MDELSDIIERLRAFTREISEIREDNRVYWMHSTHDKLEMELLRKKAGKTERNQKRASCPSATYCCLTRASIVKC